MKSHQKFYFVLFGCLIALASCSSAAPGSSRFTTDKIYSDALGEDREFCVYLPENFDPQQSYPVIYATDGQLIVSENYKEILDNLIKDKVIPPLVLIGTNSNEKTISNGMELRYYEYVENDSEDPESAGRFKNHLEFFTKEVQERILTKYAIKCDTGRCIFYGCSNGGDYGLTLYTKQQDLFTDFICLSPVGTEAEEFMPANIEAPVTLYIGYGSEEAEKPIIGDNLNALGKKLDSLKHPSIAVHIFNGGHNRNCWKQEFATALTAALN